MSRGPEWVETKCFSVVDGTGGGMVGGRTEEGGEDKMFEDVAKIWWEDGPVGCWIAV